MTNSKTIKPEVGQVWNLDDETDYILFTDNHSVQVLNYHSFYKTFVIITYDKEAFIEEAEYIGKAKGSISDLFEIEE